MDVRENSCLPTQKMKRQPLFTALLIAMTIIVSACGGKNGHFRIEGKFKNLNQGEFYIYRPYTATVDLDTIKVADGRFVYDIPLEEKTTFVIIFPNYSEQVIFGESGATAKIDGDASHLREMKITGTDDNKLMTDFRLNANKITPPEVVKAAIAFAEERPESPASLYLVNRYLVTGPNPDYAKAYELVKKMQKASPENGILIRLAKNLETLSQCATGSRLPEFTATDINGKTIKRKDALNGKVNIVTTWASWNYDSQNSLRRLNKLKKQYGNDIALLNICLDGNANDYIRKTERDSITSPTICDGEMWNTPLLKTFGLATIPSNIIADSNGTIVARNLTDQQLEEKIKAMLEKP